MVGATDDPGEGLAHGVEVVHHGSLFRREVVEMHHFRAVVKELTVQKAEEIYLDTSIIRKICKRYRNKSRGMQKIILES